MNVEQIEGLLRKAPRPPASAGLLRKLQAEIALPHPAKTMRVTRAEVVSFLRRWFPAISFAAIFLSCVVTIAVQSNQIEDLKRQNDSLRAAPQDIERLRRDNTEYQRLLAEHQELEQLRKDFAELQRLRAEVAQLRAQMQEAERMRAENRRLRAYTAASAGKN